VGWEAYIFCFTRNERRGLAWFVIDILNMREVRKGFEKGTHRLQREEGNVYIYY
jgi:hypothetical protein